MIRRTCPACGKKLIEPVGPEDAPILIAGEFGGYEEQRSGIPWVGPAGKVLRAELEHAGIKYNECRVTNLYMHQKPPKGMDPEVAEACLKWNKQQLLNEMKGRKAILVIGSEMARHFLDGGIMENEGLRVRSPLFPRSVEVAVAVRNPAMCTMKGRVLGGIREAIENFAEWSKKYG
jgi:uracil-DNA glycosylase family 4